MTTKAGPTSEQKSLEVAEASRQKVWKAPSFLRELFLGNFRLDLIHQQRAPYPLSGKERPEFTEFYERFRQFRNPSRSTLRRTNFEAATLNFQL